jgi:hypothetical protein
MMPARKDTREVDWPAVAEPILATPPWRPGASRSPQVMAEAMADPNNYDWAGPGFTRPGPESDVGYQAGYALGRVEAAAGMTATFDGPATSFMGGYVNGHRQMSEHLAREANRGEAEAGG